MAATDEAPHILKLPAVLDLNAASRLHDQILALKDKHITVDASEVTRVGAQCIQILLSAALSWRSTDKAFSINQASATFAQSLKLVGISDEALIPMETV